jgi:hypothetical protein
MMKKFFFLSFCLLFATIGNLKAQSVKIDSLKLLQEKYAHSVKFTYKDGHDPNAPTLRVKNLAEFEELLKKEVLRVERRKIKLDSLKKHAPKGSWVL